MESIADRADLPTSRGPRPAATGARSGAFRGDRESCKSWWGNGQRRAILTAGEKRVETGLTIGRGERKVANGSGTRSETTLADRVAPDLPPSPNSRVLPFPGATIGSLGTRFHEKINEPTHRRIKDRCVGSVLIPRDGVRPARQGPPRARTFSERPHGSRAIRHGWRSLAGRAGPPDVPAPRPPRVQPPRRPRSSRSGAPFFVGGKSFHAADAEETGIEILASPRPPREALAQPLRQIGSV